MKKAFQMSKKALIKIGTLVVVVVLIVTAVLVNVIRKNRLSEESLVIIPSSRKLSKAEIIELSKQWDMSKVEAVEDKNGIPVPVPFGFTESSIEGEDCVDTGFVIYKNIRGCTGEVNEENKEVCQKSRDQYVWIPVYDPRTFYGIDASGVMHGKVYEFTTSGKSAKNWSEVDGVMSIDNGSGVREPNKEALSNTEVPDYLSEESVKYNKEFYEMVKSVEKYGGFYIGRYEAKDISTNNPKIVKDGDDMRANASNVEKRLQNIDCDAIDNSGEAVDVVTTCMSYGCMYDAMLEWLVIADCKTYEEIGDSSKESWKSEIEANNIYDLENDNEEWVKTRNGSNWHMFRGGSGRSVAAYHNTTSSYTPDYGRAALFIDVDEEP